MKKLKKITLADGHELSAVEMAMLEGGDYFPLKCEQPLEACSAPFYSTFNELLGFYDGTCLYGYVGVKDNPQYYEYKLYCVPN